MSETANPSPTLADRLPFCPHCNYPFTGLPESHQCPECGLTYDAESRMWTAVASRWGMRRATNLAIGMIALYIGIIQFIGAIVTSTNVERFAHATVGVLMLCAARFFQRAWKLDQGPQSRYFATMPDGIWYVDPRMICHNLPWAQVRSAEKQSPYVDIALRIYLTPRGRVDIPRELISYSDATAVLSQIMARIEKLSS